MNDDTHSGTVAAPSGDVAQPPKKIGGGGQTGQPRLPQAAGASSTGNARQSGSYILNKPPVPHHAEQTTMRPMVWGSIRPARSP